jgi:hypothetical protein
MLLDAVLTTPDLRWLTTAAAKADHLVCLTASGLTPVEHAASSEPEPKPVVEFRGTFPIGVEPDGRTVLLYLATEAWTEAFRTFVQDHVVLLRVAPKWTLRIVFPTPLDRVYEAYQTVVHEELESPLHPATISELQWYFEHRDKANREPMHPQDQRFLDAGARVFGTPRFMTLYQQWLKRRNAVFEGPSSPVIAEALNIGAGRVESFVLPHTYRHLSPLVDHRRSRAEDVEKGVEKGAVRGDITSAHPQPPPSTLWPSRERSVLM